MNITSAAIGKIGSRSEKKISRSMCYSVSRRDSEGLRQVLIHMANGILSCLWGHPSLARWANWISDFANKCLRARKQIGNIHLPA